MTELRGHTHLFEGKCDTRRLRIKFNYIFPFRGHVWTEPVEMKLAWAVCLTNSPILGAKCEKIHSFTRCLCDARMIGMGCNITKDNKSYYKQWFWLHWKQRLREASDKSQTVNWYLVLIMTYSHNGKMICSGCFVASCVDSLYMLQR